jgi:hypothetical protein
MPTKQDVRRLASSLRSALSAVHAAGLVHRDVSPKNLLLRRSPHSSADADLAYFDPNERIVLGDLGFVKDLARSSGITVGGGTSGFSAPEQSAPSTTIDQRADVYGASAVLAWFAIGEQIDPSSRDTLPERTAALGLGKELGGVLARGMESDRDKRFSSIEAWGDAIEGALYRTAQVPAVGGGGPLTESGSRRQIGVGVGLGLMLAALLWLGSGWIGGVTDGEDLGDGRVRIQETVGESSVAIVGPAELKVGESAVFDAEVSGVSGFVWVSPDGQIYPDLDSITVVAATAGSLHVTLVGSIPGGEAIVVERGLVAVP